MKYNTIASAEAPIFWLCHVLRQHSLLGVPKRYSQLALWLQIGRGQGAYSQFGVFFKAAHQPIAEMSPSDSTDNLLNSFPMFGHPGISALEYAGSLEASHKRNTSETLESHNRISTVSTQDENSTPPTTADIDLFGPEVSTPLQHIDEFGCQQRRRGTFVNHTPRDFEMQSPRNVEVYRPSMSSSSENYSRPRSSYHTTSSDGRHTRASPCFYRPSSDYRLDDNRVSINRGAPVELSFKEMMASTTPDLCSPPATPRHSSSAPLDRTVTNQPHPANPSKQQDHRTNTRSTSNTLYPQEKKRQRRQTPFKISSPKSINVSRHTSPEPWVSDNRPGMDDHNAINLLPPVEIGDDEEMGTFGVIQRYFDSQTGGPVSSPIHLPDTCSTRPLETSLAPSNPGFQSPLQEPAATYLIDELDFANVPPPAVPDRSPNRLTYPCFSIQVDSTVSVDSEFAFAAEGQYSPYDQADSALCDQKKQTTKRIDVGQADLAGSATVGKQAPPILNHDALTAKFHRDCNDPNYYQLDLSNLHDYLRNTGPSLDPQPVSRQRKKTGIRLFKVKQRKSLATRVGSVEGSPQMIRKQIPIPACAREMTTTGGARHLKIVIPTEATLGNQSLVPPLSQSKRERDSRHISIMGDFTEEIINPLASPDVENIISEFGTPGSSASEPVAKSSRNPRRPPQSPEHVPVVDHPLASREEQTRARKLRDLQQIKRKTLPSGEQEKKYPDVVAGAPLTPAQTPEPVHDSSVDSVHEEENADDHNCDIVRIQQKVISLQRQNTELTEALAKIVGLELEEGGDINSEDVLKAFNKIRFFRTPGVA